MKDADFEKLETCFERVFPRMPKSAIPTATQDSVPEWDSIAHITLLSLVGEEFALDISFEDFEDATTFSLLLEAVRQRTANGQ